MRPVHLFDVPKFKRHGNMFVVTFKGIDLQLVIEPHIFRASIDGAEAEWFEFVADGSAVASIRKGR